MTHYTANRIVAILLGIAATLGAAWLLLDGVPSWQDLTPRQYIALLVLVIATATTHQALGAFAQQQFGHATALAFVALVSLGIVVVGSGARTAEHQATKQLQGQTERGAFSRAVSDLETARKAVTSANAQRAGLIEAARRTVTERTTDKANACTDGKGRFCAGAHANLETAEGQLVTAEKNRTLVDQAEYAVRLHEAAIERMKPKASRSDAEAFASFLHTLRLVSDAGAATVILDALLPFATAVALEIAAAVLFLQAFPVATAAQLAASAQPRPLSDLTDPLRTVAAVATVALPVLTTTLAKAVAVIPVASEQVVESQGVATLVRTMRALKGKGIEEVTVSQAAKAMRCCRPEASRRARDAGDRIKRERRGREVYISLA